jgi:hypothetical protein
MRKRNRHLSISVSDDNHEWSTINLRYRILINNYHFFTTKKRKMKKLLFLLLLLPVLGIAQTKSLLTTNRVFAKNDKTGEFEKPFLTMQKSIIPVMLPGGCGASNQHRTPADRW